MGKQTSWQLLLTSVFFVLLTSWSVQANIDPATAQKLLGIDREPNDYFGYSVSISGDTAIVGVVGNNKLKGSAYIFTRSNGVWSQQQQLIAGDGFRFGYSVSIHGDTAVVGADGDDDWKGAVYIFTRTNGVWSQQQRLTADDGDIFDRFGYSVSVSEETVIIGSPGDDDKGDGSGSGYIFMRAEDGTWTQQVKLTADDGAAWNSFGYSVSLSGDTVIVGAPYNDNKCEDSGAAYIFISNGTTWSQQQKLTASDGTTRQWFGNSVSISGDTAVIGAQIDDEKGLYSGAAYVFTRNNDVWSQQQKLIADDAAAGDNFGWSVMVSGDTAVIGAQYKDGDTGSAYIFIRTDGVWNQQQELTAEDRVADDRFGLAVSVYEDTVLIGAPYDDSTKGSAYVFIRNNGVWSQQQKLNATDGIVWKQFGYSVSVSGDVAVIGAPYTAVLDAPYDDFKGAAYIFTRSDGFLWQQQQKLTAFDGAAGDLFGYSVSVSNDTVVIGAYGDDARKGSAYVFTRINGVWNLQKKLIADDGADDDLFGYSVSISDSNIAIGARRNGDMGRGAAYVFRRIDGIWSQQQKLTTNDGLTDVPLDWFEFGCSLSISGDTIAIGATGDSDNGRRSGAVYIFTYTDGIWSQEQKLTADDGVSDDHFGYSVSVFGDTVLIGAAGYNVWGSPVYLFEGAAYVFTYTDGVWSQQQKLIADDGAAEDHFGYSVSLSRDTAIIGSLNNDDRKGAAYVFACTGGVWSQEQKLTVDDGAGGIWFGRSVSLSGDTAIIGADIHDGWKGSAYVFSSDGSNAPPVADAGSDQTILKIGSTVQLDGSQSYDPEGNSITYTWYFTTKPADSNASLNDQASATPTFNPDKYGIYSLELIVSDGSSSSVPDQVVISLNNIAPVANAGINQSVVQEESICFDGSSSSDANGDALSYMWTLTDKPAGSLAVLDNPTAVTPCITADLIGSYTVSLAVNDGTVDSTPSTAEAVAISRHQASINTLQEVASAINTFNSKVFGNRWMRKIIMRFQINVALMLVKQSNYSAAHAILQNSILGKTDGCTAAGAPDKNDWIRDCASQAQVQLLLQQAIGYLKGMK